MYEVSLMKKNRKIIIYFVTGNSWMMHGYSICDLKLGKKRIILLLPAYVLKKKKKQTFFPL